MNQKQIYKVSKTTINDLNSDKEILDHIKTIAKDGIKHLEIKETIEDSLKDLVSFVCYYD